jgi:cold shock CspA family protein/ribosome-associated translation inhibitor RaiA
MLVPLEIHFHNVDRSEAVEAAVRERAEKLEEFADDIVSCRVTVERPHKHHRRGNLFAVKVDLRFAGGEVVASREPTEHHAHEDVNVAIRDAFKAARRQLEDRVRVRRGDVKPHAGDAHGTLASIDSARGFGRIATPDGREIYFHRNSVLNARFEQLTPGTEVRFTEEAGDEGPQASSVHVIGKPHTAG